MKAPGLSLLALVWLVWAVAGAPLRAATPTLLFSDSFAQDLSQWSVEQLPGGRVGLHDGALVIEAAGGTTVWYRSRLTAPVEITYDAEVVMNGGPLDRLSDLNCFWMAQDPARPDGAPPAARSGRFADYDSLRTYYVGCGGNGNSTTRFRRYDGTGDRPLRPADDLHDPRHLLVPNHVYHVKLVARNGVAEFWRDGSLVFSFADPAPLASGYFAFRTVHSHLLIRHFKITPLPAAP